MNRKLLRGLRQKENKSEVEQVALNYSECIANISEILVDESKKHLSSDEAIYKIREYMANNL